jgi:hypothetical protein
MFGCASLAPEHAPIAAMLVGEHLDGDFPAGFDFFGQIDPPHAAHAEQVQHAVAIQTQPATPALQEPLGLVLGEHLLIEQRLGDLEGGRLLAQVIPPGEGVGFLTREQAAASDDAEKVLGRLRSGHRKRRF